MTKNQTIPEQKLFNVSTNFSDALIRLRDDENIVDLIKKAEGRCLSERIIDSIVRKSFTVRLVALKDKKETDAGPKESEYSSATVFELLPFLQQYPEYRRLSIVAEGSWWSPGAGDIFNITNKASSNKKELALKYDCFNFCCIDKRNEEGYYALEIKN